MFGFLRLSYLAWIAVPVAAYAVYALIGPPYLLWSYTWRDNGQGYDISAHRYFLRCTYAGPAGSFTVHFPSRGECSWVRFYKPAGEGEG